MTFRRESDGKRRPARGAAVTIAAFALSGILIILGLVAAAGPQPVPEAPRYVQDHDEIRRYRSRAEEPRESMSACVTVTIGSRNQSYTHTSCS